MNTTTVHITILACKPANHSITSCVLAMLHYSNHSIHHQNPLDSKYSIFNHIFFCYSCIFSLTYSLYTANVTTEKKYNLWFWFFSFHCNFFFNWCWYRIYKHHSLKKQWIYQTIGLQTTVFTISTKCYETSSYPITGDEIEHRDGLLNHSLKHSTHSG